MTILPSASGPNLRVESTMINGGVIITVGSNGRLVAPEELPKFVLSVLEHAGHNPVSVEDDENTSASRHMDRATYHAKRAFDITQKANLERLERERLDREAAAIRLAFSPNAEILWRDLIENVKDAWRRAALEAREIHSRGDDW